MRTTGEAMSELPPSTPAPGEPVDLAAPLGSTPRRGRRTAVIAAVSVGAVAVLGGGAAAAALLLGGHGPQPEEVLPASTLAEVSVDTDPSATQKLAAYETLRKFPVLRKDLGVDSGQDLRRTIFQLAVKGTGCRHVDFDKDVAPWLGSRAAVAAVDLQGRTPAPAVVVQVSDQGRARAGIDRLVGCGHPGKDFGYAFADGYVVLSDSTDHARTIVAAGQQSPLSADAGYTRWAGEVGDRGVVNFYVARKAGDWLVHHARDLTGGGLAGARTDALARQARTFQGLAGTVRFSGGGLEVAAVSGAVEGAAGGGTVAGAIGRLPADTAAAFGVAVPPDYARTLVDSLSNLSGESAGQLVAQAETMTGLRLPGDLQTLLGRSITVSLGGNPPDLRSVSGPADVPFGVTVTGDTARIEGILQRVAERQGVSLAQLGVVERSGGGRVALASSPAYADRLLGAGGLAGSATFRDVVPEAGRASAVGYVDFDSGWVDAIEKLAGQTGAPAGELAEVRANLAPLKALGASTWQDGSTSHVLVKVTTD